MTGQLQMFTRYRIIEQGGSRTIMQGTFGGVDDVRAYLKKRIEVFGANHGTYKLEQERNGKWVHETTLTV